MPLKFYRVSGPYREPNVNPADALVAANTDDEAIRIMIMDRGLKGSNPVNWAANEVRVNHPQIICRL